MPGDGKQPPKTGDKPTPVTWVYELSKEHLETNLRVAGLDVEGTVDELRKRFIKFLKKDGTPPPSNESEVPAPPKTNITSVTTNVSNVCTQVRKWGLNYDGMTDAVSFLERIQELRQCYDIKDADMLTALPQIFKGNALLWYRNNRDIWQTWSDFLCDFKTQYLHPRYDRQIEEEIRARHQRPKESFKDFLTTMSTLIRRGKTMSPLEKYERLYDNMRPEYKLYIQRDVSASIPDLARKATEYEQILDEQKKSFSSLAKDGDNKSRNGNGTTVRQHNAAQTKHSTNNSKNRYPGQDKYKQGQKSTTADTDGKLSEPNKRCWRCSGKGHLRKGCRNPVKLFCGRCGQVDVLSKNCKCQGNGQGRQLSTVNCLKTVLNHASTANKIRNQQEKQDTRIWVTVKLNGIDFRAMCDTGASASFISRETADTLQEKGVKRLHENVSRICLADGRTVEALGHMVIPTRLNNHTLQTDFLIMPNTGYSVILGIDILAAFDAMVNVRQRKVIFTQSNDSNYHDTHLNTVAKVINEKKLPEFLEGKIPKASKKKRRTPGVKHVTTLKPRVVPVKQRNYPYSPKKQGNEEQLCTVFKKISCPWYNNKAKPVNKEPVKKRTTVSPEYPAVTPPLQKPETIPVPVKQINILSDIKLTMEEKFKPMGSKRVVMMTSPPINLKPHIAGPPSNTSRPVTKFIGPIFPKRTKSAHRYPNRLCSIHVGEEKLIMTRRDAIRRGLLQKLEKEAKE